MKNDDKLSAYILSVVMIAIFWAFTSGLMMFGGIRNPVIHTITAVVVMIALVASERFKK